MEAPTITKVTRYSVYDPVTGLRKEYALSDSNAMELCKIMLHFVEFCDSEGAFPDCWHDLYDILVEYLEKE